MIVVKAPLRISLFGGGTDLPEYADTYGSTIISFAINRHMYVGWNDRPTGGCRLSYGEVEELDTLKDARHTLVRAWAESPSVREPCTLTITSDVPKGTGLGSSSALAVALCALFPYWIKEKSVDQAAYELERSISPVGFQDHLPATFGGFRIYVGRSAFVSHREMPTYIYDIIEKYGMLFYTGEARESAPILHQWKTDTVLHDIRALADKVSADRWTLGARRIGEYLDQTWKMKSRVPGVTSDLLDSQYDIAINAGAWGGKLLGAGGGGCWFFMVPTRARDVLREALGLVEIPFEIAHKGVERIVL